MEHRVITVQESMDKMQSIALENLKNPVHREFLNDTIIEASKHEAPTTTSTIAASRTHRGTLSSGAGQRMTLWPNPITQ